MYLMDLLPHFNSIIKLPMPSGRFWRNFGFTPCCREKATCIDSKKASHRLLCSDRHRVNISDHYNCQEYKTATKLHDEMSCWCDEFCYHLQCCIRCFKSCSCRSIGRINLFELVPECKFISWRETTMVLRKLNFFQHLLHIYSCSSLASSLMSSFSHNYNGKSLKLWLV